MTVSDIYNLIGSNIKSAISEDWTDAELKVEGDSTYAETSGFYLTTNGNKQNLDVHLFDDDLEFSIMELHEITTEGGNNKWNRLKYKLTSDNKFDIEFIWDQELHDEIERQPV